MTTKLYKHTTDGGAEYLCIVEDDLSTAIVRLDEEPELVGAHILELEELVRTLAASEAKVKVQRADLLDALKNMLDAYNTCQCGCDPDKAWQAASALIGRITL